MTPLFLHKHVARLSLFAAASLLLTCAAIPALAQSGSYRDRGDRYSRAQSDDGGAYRNRTRFDDNSRPDRGGADFTRSHNNYNRGGYDRSSDRSYGRGYDNDRYQRYDGNRYDRGHYSPRSSVSIGFGASSGYGYRQPVYDGAYYDRGYGHGYRNDYYRPYYGHTTRSVTYTHSNYGYRPSNYYCRPAYGYNNGYYPRYNTYSRSSVNFGVRYNYYR